MRVLIALPLALSSSLHAAPRPVADAWLSEATAAIAEAERAMSLDASGGFVSRRRDGMSAQWRDGSLSVRPDAAAWSLRMTSDGIGRSQDMRSAAVTAERIDAGRLEWTRADGIVEWHRSDACGLEWGYDIARRPAGAGSLTIAARLELEGAWPVAGDGATVTFVDESGRAVLEAQGLLVTDAAGARVPARLDATQDVLTITIDDARAVYPLHVDPYLTAPSSSFESNLAGANMGISVASAGDVNGDGYGDIIVGAYLFTNAQSQEGAAFVFFGSAFGVDAVPDWRGESDQAMARLGSSVASAGDVNGDGYGDVIVGAPLYDTRTTDVGAAFVFHGGPAFGGNVPATFADGVLVGDQASSSFGASVASAGDVNRDGYADVLVGASRSDAGGTDSGAAYAFSGSPGGVLGFGAATAAWPLVLAQAGANFGVSVSGAGDTNGDGYSDVIVGADLYDNGQLNEGGAFVYVGGPTGLGAVPAWRAEGELSNTWFGHSVATAWSVNCDRYTDIIVGAPQGTGKISAHFREGWVAVWLGGPPAFPGDAGLGPDGTPTNADWFAESNQSNSRFGWSVAGVRDERCASCSDVLVGAPWWDEAGITNRGVALAWEGGPGGLGPNGQTHLSPASGGPDWATLGLRASDEHGASVAGLVSVDADRMDDLLIGDPGWDNPQFNEGRALLYLASVPAGADCDADGIPDACDLAPCNRFACNDSDFDGCDDCAGGAGDLPFSDGLDTDGDGACNFGDADDDNDGVLDGADNCPLVYNPAQSDNDADGVGDACDNDDDNDGVNDGSDNCPFVFNPGQQDCDADGIGDACEPDFDGDGVVDDCDPCPFSNPDDADVDSVCDDLDNCTGAFNPGQQDCDADGIGDACEPDFDGDGVVDDCDPCPASNPDDADVDSVCDDVDNCTGAFNPFQQDCDADGIGDACESDFDGDGVVDDCDPCPASNPDDADFDSICDDVDNCTGAFNPFQQDCDADGIGDACESDVDGDGVPDQCDSESIADGNCLDTLDNDGDGLTDLSDPDC